MPRKTTGPGRTAGRAARSRGKRPGYLRPLRILRYAAFAFLGATVAGVLLFRFVPVPCTPLMLIRLAEQAIAGRPLRIDKSWRPLERISPRLAEAVVAAEDQRFFAHHGFDWEAIAAAFTSNGRGRRKLGASTITQQTAKNLFLWPDRTWLRKGLEAWFTLWLEALWPKRRILEVYLNIIETGEGTYGAEAAARRYFGTSAAGLDAARAALIAASLPNPRKWSPARPTAYLRRRQAWILRQADRLDPLPWVDPRMGRRAPARTAPVSGLQGTGIRKGAWRNLADTLAGATADAPDSAPPALPDALPDPLPDPLPADGSDPEGAAGQ